MLQNALTAFLFSFLSFHRFTIK